MSARSKKINNNFVYDEYNNFTTWEAATDAAERLLLRIQIREREVKAAIRLFRERKKAGEPWPGQESKAS
jgi:hypothetical protein